MKPSPIQRLTQVFPKPVRRALLISLFLSPLLADIGCQHIGPPTIADDRLAYNTAVKKSWEQQVLLNIVRVRYDDLVQFVDVGPMVQTHTLMGTTGASFGSSIFPWDKIMNTLTPGLSATRTTTDSPNITYTPLTGSDFTRNLNAPIKPGDIFSNLIESGYPADVLMNLTLRSVDDITSTRDGVNPNSKFKRLAQAVKYAHSWGDLSFESDGTKSFMVIEDIDSAHSQKGPLWVGSPVAYIRQTLHLKAAATQFEIVPGPHPTKETEIAIGTRSVIAAMRWLSYYVHVPDGSAPETKLEDESDPPITVVATTKKPSDSFATIQYQGYWFSIPNLPKTDSSRSKFSLICLRTLLALADTGARPTAPVLTIPTR